MLTLNADGAERYPHFLKRGSLSGLQRLTKASEPGRAGVRLTGNPELLAWLGESGVTDLASRVLRGRAQPVRAILFDKSSVQNWSLGWHQDRTIVVRQRADVPGFGPWSRKSGLTHVEPPFDVIEAMVTARVHIDPVPADNAPLRIAPGSHRAGKVIESGIDALVQRCGTYACLADAGDIWVYRTSVLHASAPSEVAGRRRVLQIDFASVALPFPLEWRGID